jgi:hypothetical protein
MLRAGRDEIDRNLGLMTPVASIEVGLQAVVTAGLDPDEVADALRGMDLTRAAGTLHRVMTEPPPPPLPPPPEEAPEIEVVAPRDRAIEPALDGEQAALF